MTNVLTIVAKLRAAKGKGNIMAALLMEQVSIVGRTEPGCLIYRLHQSIQNPDLFMFYEQYKDDAAFDAHGKATRLDDFRKRCEEDGLTEGPVDEAIKIEIYRSMSS